MRKVIAETQYHKPVVLDMSGYDRIRAQSSERVNSEIDRRTEAEIIKYSNKDNNVISRRIEELDREWDIDRTIMLLFSCISPVSVGLGVKRNRNWFGLFALQLSFLALHAVRGWCPPASLLRRMGFRSRSEIDAEKYALKTLRGDFASQFSS